MGEQPVAADLRQRVLRRVELLLRLEHLEVAREAEAVSIRGVLDGLLQRLHGPALPRLGLAQLAQGGERIRNFPQRDEHRLLVLELRLLPLRDRGPVVPEGAAGVQERPAERPGDRPDRRGAARERRHLGARRAEQRGQAQLREELGLGDADARVGAHELLLRLAEVGPPREERRRQPGRHRRHHRLRVHRRPPRNRRRRLAQQDADLILLGDDVALELRDRRLRFTESALGPRGLEPGRGAELEPILEDVERPLVGVGAVAGDVEPHVELQQLEVGLRQVADQRQPDAAPGVLGGQEGRPRRLVRAPDAAPDVQLPRRRERAVIEVVGGVGLSPGPTRHASRDVGSRHAGAVVERRIEVRSGDAEIGPRLPHTRSGDLDVVVVAQRFLDQVLQNGVLEHLPPRRVGQRGGLRRRLAAERRGLGHGRALVVRADRAAAQQSGRDDTRDDPCRARHGCSASVDGPPSVPPLIGASAGVGRGAFSDSPLNRSLT